LSIYIVLVLLFVLVLVIVTKMSLFIAILYYDDDDEDDAGLSSGAGTNLKVRGTCQARSAGNFLSYPSNFLALQVQSVVFVSASVWSVLFVTFLFVVVLTLGAPVPSHL